MTHSTNQTLNADCDDLLPARDCIADLKSSPFDGEVKITESSPHDPIQVPFQAYGSRLGESAFRTAIAGSVIGLVAGATISAFFSAGLAALIGAGSGLILGGCVGGISAVRRGKLAVERDSGENGLGRFLVQCQGSTEQIAVAYAVLQKAPCRNLRVHKSAPDPAATDRRCNVALTAS